MNYFPMRVLFLSLLAFITQCHNDIPKISGRPEEDIIGNLAFVNANVISMMDDKILRNQTVLISNGNIAEVGEDIVVPQNYFTIDAKDQYLMPGLADMHTHVNYEEDLLPYVANGVTTILNMGGPSSILELRRKGEQNEIISPTIFASAFVDGAGDRGWVITTPSEVIADVAQIKSMGWDFIKVYNSLKKEVFISLQAEAARNNLAIVGHGVREPGMEFILSNGQVMVSHMEEYLYTHFKNELDADMIPSAINLSKSHGTYVTPNLSAYEALTMQWGNPEGLETLLNQNAIKYVSPKWKEFWKSLTYTSRSGSIEPQYNFLKILTKRFDDANVPLLLGTDSPFIPGLPNGFSIHDDLRNMVEAGISPFNALKAGTRTPGEFLSKFVLGAPKMGLVQQGYRANLLLLEANPLEDLENLKRRTGILINGRWMSEKFLQKRMIKLVE